MEKNKAGREWGVRGVRCQGGLPESVTFELEAEGCESELGRCAGKRNLRQKEQHQQW